jgi:cell division protein FtsQ
MRGATALAPSRYVYRGPTSSSPLFQKSKRVWAATTAFLIGLAQRAPKGFGSFVTALLFIGTVGFGLYRGGHLDAFVSVYGDPRSVIARMAGFDIRSVTISGLSGLDEQEVLAAAAITPAESLPFLDIDDVRKRLLEMPMVRDVAVRKFYPNALSIGIVENKPYGVWQLDGELSVVGIDGRVIGPLNDTSYAALPLVVGQSAGGRIGDFVALLDAQPDLKPLIRAGIWVGERRWTLKLFNGFDVHLPEDQPAEAMARFAVMVRDHKILDKDLVSVDLRQSDRVVLRLTEAAATARAELLKARAKAKGGPA